MLTSDTNTKKEKKERERAAILKLKCRAEHGGRNTYFHWI